MRALIAALTLSVSFTCISAQAAAPTTNSLRAEAAVQFSIGALPLSQALRVYAEQSGDQVVFYSDVGKGRESTPVEGVYTPEQALQRLLRNTGLKQQRVNQKTVAISAESPPTAAVPEASLQRIAATQPLRLAQATPAPGARAQPSEAAAEMNTLEEVIVTGTAGGAELRKLDASFAISTVSAEDISRAAPASTADLFKTVPGVWSESASGVSGANIMVRGLPGTSDAPWVSVQINGAPIYPPSTLSFLENSTMFRIDETIERMEALRGGPNPIFSNGQPGLTTNFILKEGGDITEGSVKYSISDYDLSRVDAVLSGPISDGFYYMIGGYLSSSDGVRDAGFSSEEGHQFTINLTREFDSGVAKVFHRLTDDHGTWYLPQDLLNTSLDAGYTQVGPLNRQQTIEYSVPAVGGGSETRRETFDMGEGRGWDGSVTGGSVEFELGDTGIVFTDRMSLTKGDANTYGLVPSGGGVLLNTLTDANGVLLTGGGTGATTGRAIPGTARVQLFGPWVVQKEVEAFTNDLSLAKTWGETKVTVGYYSSSFSVDEFWSINNEKWFEQRHNGELIAEVACNGVAQQQTDSCGGNFDVDANGDANSDALYLAGEIGLGPVRLDAGVRFGKYGAQYTADTGALDGVVDAFADTDESKTSYTAAANWSINDWSGVFVRFNEGYLEPFFDDFRNNNELLNVNGLDLFQKVRQYEAGYKMTTGPFALFATYFRSDVEGAPSGCVVGGVVPCLLQENEAQGVEIDANVAIAGDFVIDLNATWQDTEIQNGPNAGNEVGRQPTYQFRVTPRYTLEFGDGYDATFYATLSVIDDRQADDANTDTLDGYEKVDLGVLVNVSDLSFQLAADNVTDEEGLTERDARDPTSPNARYILPRNFKFTVGYHF